MGGASNIDTMQPHVYCNVDSTAGTTTTAVSHHGAVGGRRSGAVNSRGACRTSSRNSNLVTVVTSSSGRGGLTYNSSGSRGRGGLTTSASRTSTFQSSRNASAASTAPPTTVGQHQSQQQSRSNSRTNLTIAPPTMLSAPDLSCPVATAMTSGSGSFSIAVNREWMALPSLPRSSAVATTTTGQGAGFGSNVEMGFAPPPPRSAPASTGGRGGLSARQKFFGGEQLFQVVLLCRSPVLDDA